MNASGQKASPVGIDTNILIYEMQSEEKLQREPDEEKRQTAVKLHRQSKRLLRTFHEEKRQITVSVISVGEYLVGVPVAKHADMIRLFEQRFFIAPYNLRAASIAAHIVAETKQTRKTVRVVGDRPVIMADIKIIASMIASGTKTVYFNDGDATKIAEQFLTAKTLPMGPDNLLDYAEDQDLQG